MSSLFKAVLTKKEQNSQNQKSSKTTKSSATPKVKALPPDFFEQVLICEIQMKRSFSMPLLQKLINYYSQAIEYYESICDPRFARYSKSLQLLLMQPEVMKHITLQSSKGKIKVQKQERKKEIMDELHNVDKKFEKDNKDIHNLIAQKNAPEKKEDINKAINNVLDEQTNNFKKKLEEKKKRKLLSLNEESGSNDKSNSIEEKNNNNKSK